MILLSTREIDSHCSGSLLTLLGIGYGHSRLHIRIVIGGDLPFVSLLHQDLQQSCAEASLVIGIRAGKQLLNSGHGRKHFHDGNIRPDEL